MDVDVMIGDNNKPKVKPAKVVDIDFESDA